MWWVKHTGGSTHAHCARLCAASMSGRFRSESSRSPSIQNDCIAIIFPRSGCSPQVSWPYRYPNFTITLFLLIPSCKSSCRSNLERFMASSWLKIASQRVLRITFAVAHDQKVIGPVRSLATTQCSFLAPFSRGPRQETT